MLKIADAINKKEFREIEMIVLPLETTLGQIGAGRLQFICNLILKAFDNLRDQRILLLYQQLVEEIYAFREFSAELLGQFYGEAYVNTSKERDFDVSKNYNVVYD